MDSSYAAGSHNYMIAIQKTVKPMWEVRSTYDICADIAGHLGLREQYTEGRTQAQWAEMHYQQIREKRPYLPEWSVAKEMGVIDQRIATEQQSLAFADFRADARLIHSPRRRAKLKFTPRRWRIWRKRGRCQKASEFPHCRNFVQRKSRTLTKH